MVADFWYVVVVVVVIFVVVVLHLSAIHQRLRTERKENGDE